MGKTGRVHVAMVCNLLSCHWISKECFTVEWFIFVSREQIVNGIDWSISILAHLVFLVSEPLNVFLLSMVFHINIFSNQYHYLTDIIIMHIESRWCIYTEQTLLVYKGSYFWTVKIKLVLINTFTDYNQTFCSKYKFPISLEDQPGKRLHL